MHYVLFAYLTGSKELYFEEHAGKTIGDLWKSLADKLTSTKPKKFKSILAINFEQMFEPLVFNKNVKVCAVTGIERTDCVKLEPKDKDEDATWVLPLVKRQAELGYVLKDVDYVVTNLAKFGNTYLDK